MRLEEVCNILKRKREPVLDFSLEIHLAAHLPPYSDQFHAKIPLRDKRLERKGREKGVFFLPCCPNLSPVCLHKRFARRLLRVQPCHSKLSRRISDSSRRRSLQGASTLKASMSQSTSSPCGYQQRLGICMAPTAPSNINRSDLLIMVEGGQ